MSTVHGIGIIGAGLMGERMLTALDRDARFETRAVFDPRADRLAQLRETFSFETTDSEAELLARDDLAAVYIASPPAHHVASALAALDRGLPIFLEKPLAPSVDDAARLVDAFEGSDVPAAMHFPFATLPELGRIDREWREGTIGAPVRVEVVLHFSAWPRTWHHAGDWLRGSAEGGFLREVYSHFAYLSQRWLGPAEVVSVARVDAAPTSVQAGAGCETSITATMTAGGVPITLVGGVGGAAPDFNRWTLYATGRSLRLEDWRRMSSSDGEEWAPLDPDPDPSPPEDRGTMAALDRMLRGEEHALATLRDGLEVARVVEALRGAPAVAISGETATADGPPSERRES